MKGVCKSISEQFFIYFVFLLIQYELTFGLDQVTCYIMWPWRRKVRRFSAENATALCDMDVPHCVDKEKPCMLQPTEGRKARRC